MVLHSNGVDIFEYPVNPFKQETVKSAVFGSRFHRKWKLKGLQIY